MFDHVSIRVTDREASERFYGTGTFLLAEAGCLDGHRATTSWWLSPLFGPPYTNLQASLTYGAATFELGVLYSPFYHFVAGIFPNNDTNNIPTGLRYTDVSRWNAFLAAARPFESSTLLRDTDAITCGQGPTGAFDDHLADVTVPVLYVGAGGGFGRAGLYSLTLLGSKDVTTHLVSFFGPDKAAFDFGHVDLFYARQADQLVWKPIYDWLNEHPPGQAEPATGQEIARSAACRVTSERHAGIACQR